MITTNGNPDLSVILITPDSYNTIRKTIRCLRMQDVKDRLEIVIVTPSEEDLYPNLQELEDFHHHTVVEIGKINSIGSAYAAGIRQAKAHLIALAEDHSYPMPGWASALITAHQQPWAAVGPVILNANSGSFISWADLFIAYGPWLDPESAGIMNHLPGHNSSYKRSILMDYGTKLEAMMEAETVLHWDLRAKGHQLYLEPSAKTSHTNFGLLSSLIVAQFYSGRQFAASRAAIQSWSLIRKFFFAGASPLIPIVRLFRILKDLKPPGRKRPPIQSVLPPLVLALIVDAIGQSIGCILGEGNAPSKLIGLEFHRDQHQQKNTLK